MSAGQESTAWKQVLYGQIGERVRDRRRAAGLSLREVAEALGGSYQSAARIEQGEMAPIAFLVAFAQLVKCEIGELVPLVPVKFNRRIEKGEEG